jgi:hypothetical protein
MSDNASEGSYNNEKVKDKFRNTKGAPGSITGDFKFELGRKTQTFHSDVEEQNLPPILKKQKK